jgi:integration host factor subunit alpha
MKKTHAKETNIPSSRYARVQSILNQEGYLPKERCAKTFDIGPLDCFSPDVISVTSAIHASGQDAYQVHKSVVIRFYMDLFIPRIISQLRTPTFTRTELASELSETFGFSGELSKRVVGRTIDAIRNALIARKNVEFRGLGVFKVVTRKAKVSRNPKNVSAGEIPIPARTTVKFSTGIDLERRLHSTQSEATVR